MFPKFIHSLSAVLPKGAGDTSAFTSPEVMPEVVGGTLVFVSLYIHSTCMRVCMYVCV